MLQQEDWWCRERLSNVWAHNTHLGENPPPLCSSLTRPKIPPGSGMSHLTFPSEPTLCSCSGFSFPWGLYLDHRQLNSRDLCPGCL